MKTSQAEQIKKMTASMKAIAADMNAALQSNKGQAARMHESSRRSGKTFAQQQATPIIVNNASLPAHAEAALNRLAHFYQKPIEDIIAALAQQADSKLATKFDRSKPAGLYNAADYYDGELSLNNLQANAAPQFANVVKFPNVPA